MRRGEAFGSWRLRWFGAQHRDVTDEDSASARAKIRPVGMHRRFFSLNGFAVNTLTSPKDASEATNHDAETRRYFMHPFHPVSLLGNCPFMLRS
jgi:hypothetical protein